MDQLRERYNEQTKKVKDEIGPPVKFPAWSGCFCKNENHRLSFMDFSIVFGGHPLWIDGDGPIHQKLHRDFTNFTSPPAGSFPCGSLIVPLENKRKVYIGHPNTNTITTRKNQLLLFAGDVPHGGMTLLQKEWDVCLHGHLANINENQDGELDIDVCADLLGKDGYYIHPKHVVQYVEDRKSLEKHVENHRFRSSQFVSACSALLSEKKITLGSQLNSYMNELKNIFTVTTSNRKRRASVTEK